MATFRRRKGRWQVQVRRTGSPSLSRTFTNRRDANVWARETERSLDLGDLRALSDRDRTTTLGALLERYRHEVTPRKKSRTVETYRIGLILRHSISRVAASRLTSSMIAAFRDERLQTVSGETVRQDLVLIRQVLETARREWSLQLPANPVNNVSKPKGAIARNRRPTASDAEKLSLALYSIHNASVRDAIEFALASGMRRGEILRVEAIHFDQSRSILQIPISKNGRPRTIPLSEKAVAILEKRIAAGAEAGMLFPTSPNAIKLAWRRLCKRAGLIDLRFHDLRHEAISSFFEAGLSVPEVALISGHRDLRQLMRYTHLDAERIARKLAYPAATIQSNSDDQIGEAAPANVPSALERTAGGRS